MLKKFCFLFLIVASLPAVSQEALTTFILVRHAEKANDGTKDPDLTTEGKMRALVLARVLKETKVDAIYSTAFRRTQNTVAPLALAKGLTVGMYEPMTEKDADTMIQRHKGQTVVVSGHSNTTPWFANFLVSQQQFKDFDDGDYDNILIVTFTTKGNAKVTWLTY